MLGVGRGEGADGCLETLSIELINVQGLTDIKMMEISEILTNKDKEEHKLKIICMVETHEKYIKLDWSEEISVVREMRSMDDKRGGGLAMIMLKKEFICTKIENKNKDMLAALVEVGKEKIVIITVYMDVNDIGRNGKIYEEVS